MSIVVCPDDGTVEVCAENPDDIEVCTCPPLLLLGDEFCEVGNVYTATGGRLPLSFSFDSGTISTTATTCTILTINECTQGQVSRAGNITVTDSCDIMQTAAKQVRLDGGQWVVTGWTIGATYNENLSTCSNSNGDPEFYLGNGVVHSCEDNNGDWGNYYRPAEEDLTPCTSRTDYVDIIWHYCDEILEWQCL